MTIDEVIEELKNGAYFTNREKEQIAEWLEELKEYKQKPEGWMWDEAEQKGYNKAIDECLRITTFYKDEWDGIYNAIEEIEQLKAGGNDEQKRQNN